MREKMEQYHFAMVIGATGGIGYRVACELANRVKKIYLFATTVEKLAVLENDLHQINNRLSIHAEPLNFADDDLNLKLKIEALNLENSVGVLANCAGTYLSRTFAGTTEDCIHKHFSINAMGPMQIVAHTIDYLQPGSLIINIGSSLSYQPKSNRVLASAVKHAVRGFSLSLAEELAESGIRVCLLNPRSVATPLLQKNSSSAAYQQAMPVEDLVNAISMILNCDRKTLFSEINVGASQGFLGK